MAFDLDSFFDDAMGRLGDGAAGGGHFADGAELTVSKSACYVQASDELLMDTGAIPDTRTHKPPSLRTRIRWRVAAAREHGARWAYRRIAGYDAPECDC